MALLYMDSFAHGEGSRYVAGAGASAQYLTTTPRFPGAAYLYRPNATRAIPASGTVGVGVGIYPASASTSQQYAAYLAFLADGGAVQHVTIQRNITSGLLEVRRGAYNGTLLATGSTALPADAWFHIEAQVTIHDTTGTVKIRLNGSPSLEIDYTGDTRNGGTSQQIEAVAVSRSFTSALGGDAVADWYIVNDTTWRGDCRVQALLPNGNGATSQGTNSAGNSTNNYTYVDDTPFSATDYVGVSTIGNGDTYTMTDLAASTSTVHGIQTAFYAAKSDAGAMSIKRRLRVSGVTYTEAATALGTTYGQILGITETNPQTSSAWTPSDINALEVGFEAA